jgi:DNA polymerase family A
MGAEQLYRRLTNKGFLVTSEDGRHVYVSPAKRLSNADRQAIRESKRSLIAYLKSKEFVRSTNQLPGNPKPPKRKLPAELARFRLGDEEIVVRRYTRSLAKVFSGRFALDCETAMVEGHHVPPLALVSVSDGRRHYLLHPDDLSVFLLAHRDQPVVFHNAAFDFWVVHKHLVQRQHSKAVAAWMNLLGSRRLRDTMMLDMLIRLASGFGKSPEIVPRGLGEIALTFTKLQLHKDNPFRLRFHELIGADWSTADPAFFEYALADAIATARVYTVLQREATRLMREYGFDPQTKQRFGIDPKAISKFGVLTESIQVGASVALEQISREGMHTDQRRLAQTAVTQREELENLICRITRDYPGLFKLDALGKVIRTAKTDVPSKSNTALDGYLLRALEQIVVKTGEDIEVPRTPKGRIAKSFDAWAPLVGINPFLKLWFEYESVAKLCQFLKSLDGAVIRPRYRVLCRTGRTTCSNPNMQQVPRQDDFREVIVPSPGHLLLAVDYRFIELVTLGAVCERRFGFSRLADVIREGIDPHCHTAAMLLGMSYKEFKGMENSEPKKFKRFRQMAKPVNFGVPGGLGADTLVEYARKTYGVGMTPEEARLFRSRLIEDVYPELKLYLTDSSLKTLAKNLNVSPNEFNAAFGVDIELASRTAGSIRKVVSGRPVKEDGTPYSEHYVERVWDTLNELNRQPELTGPLCARIGSPNLADTLFFTSVATLSGRIRAGVLYTSERNTQFQGLAADGAKIALTNLIVEGFRVSGFVHDEILIEMPDEGGYVNRRIVDEVVRIICRSMEEVTYGVPVSCEFTLSTCWSKRAKLIQSGDRVLAWKPDRSGGD